MKIGSDKIGPSVAFAASAIRIRIRNHDGGNGSRVDCRSRSDAGKGRRQSSSEWLVCAKEDEAGCGSLSLISGRVVVTIDPVLAQIDSTSNLDSVTHIQDTQHHVSLSPHLCIDRPFSWFECVILVQIGGAAEARRCTPDLGIPRLYRYSYFIS